MRLWGAVLAAMLAVGACGSPSTIATSTTAPDPETTVAATGPAAELAAARQRWAESGLDTYSFRMVDDCGECDPSMRQPQTVVVWSGEPAGANLRTIESLFARIDDAIADGRNVEVSYHPDSGHPTEISIDMQDRAFDGGHHLLVEDLVAGLPGEDLSLDDLEQARTLWETTRPVAYEFRITMHCGCEFDGTIRTRVEHDQIIDWEAEFAEETDGELSPITIDTLFDDLASTLSQPGGLESGGVRYTGSAAYHPEMGYPTWIGLDIEVLDPDPEVASLPPRLAISVSQFTPVEVSEEPETISELEQARSRWQDAGPSSYRYELILHDIQDASLSDPYRVTVSNGTVTKVEYRDALADDTPPAAVPIDELFDLIEQRIDLGDSVDALYNDDFGYPVLVTIRDGRSQEIFSIHHLVSG